MKAAQPQSSILTNKANTTWIKPKRNRKEEGKAK
jgi:hypothetical protein